MIYKIIRNKFSAGTEHEIYNDSEILTYRCNAKIREHILSDMSKDKKSFIKSQFSFSPKYLVSDNHGNYVKLKGKMNFKELIKEIIFESNCITINANETIIEITEDTFTVTDITSGNLIAKINEGENKKSEIVYTVDVKSTKYLELILGLVIGIDQVKY